MRGSPSQGVLQKSETTEPLPEAALLEEGAAPDVAVLGNVLAEISAYPVNDLPQADSFETDCSITAQIGGGGGSCATCLGRLSQRVALIGRVGDDDLGDMLVKILNREGVDCSMVRVDDVSRTCVNLVLVELSGTRHSVQDPGANANVVKYDVEWSRLKESRIFYACGLEFLPRLPPSDLRALFATAREMGITTILNPTSAFEDEARSKDWEGCLEYTDILRLNMAEARRLSGTRDLEEAARILMGKERHAVVITLGPRGHLIAEPGKSAVYGKVFDARVTSRLGAGAAFDAGFITGVMQDLPLAECARWGAAVAAFSVRGPNAFSSVPGIEAVRRALRIDSAAG